MQQRFKVKDKGRRVLRSEDLGLDQVQRSRIEFMGSRVAKPGI